MFHALKELDTITVKNNVFLIAQKILFMINIQKFVNAMMDIIIFMDFVKDVQMDKFLIKLGDFAVQDVHKTQISTDNHVFVTSDIIKFKEYAHNAKMVGFMNHRIKNADLFVDKIRFGK